MIYIVSGHPRYGTSLMMHILKTIGIPLYYSEKRENQLKKSTLNNPYFYEVEHLNVEIDVLEGKAVKAMSPTILGKKFNFDPRRIKVIYMHRDRMPWHAIHMIKNHPQNWVKSTMDQLQKILEEEDIEQACMKSIKTLRARPLFSTHRGLVETYYAFDTIIIDYHMLIDRTKDELRRLQIFLGMEFNVEEVSRVVDENLRHMENMSTCYDSDRYYFRELDEEQE